jgi:sugar O-acyltransferase (sialic acid O-acetyltransferase NeuD family)
VVILNVANQYIFLGSGGHASVLFSILEKQIDFDLVAVADVAEKQAQIFKKKKIVSDHQVLDYDELDLKLINGLGSVKSGLQRSQLFKQFKYQQYQFESIIDDTAIVAEDVLLSEGVQITAGAIVQMGSALAENVLINTRAVVEHHCVIDAHVHVATGAILCGAVSVGESSFIGAGSVIKQGITIGRQCTVGAGAVVVKDVPDYATVVGIPARIV